MIDPTLNLFRFLGYIIAGSGFDLRKIRQPFGNPDVKK